MRPTQFLKLTNLIIYVLTIIFSTLYIKGDENQYVWSSLFFITIVLIGLSSSYLAWDAYKGFLVFKLEARVDFFIRIIGFLSITNCIQFTENKVLLSILMMISIISFITNYVLEELIDRKYKKYLKNNPVVKIDSKKIMRFLENNEYDKAFNQYAENIINRFKIMIIGVIGFVLIISIKLPTNQIEQLYSSLAAVIGSFLLSYYYKVSYKFSIQFRSRRQVTKYILISLIGLIIAMFVSIYVNFLPAIVIFSLMNLPLDNISRKVLIAKKNHHDKVIEELDKKED